MLHFACEILWHIACPGNCGDLSGINMCMFFEIAVLHCNVILHKYCAYFSAKRTIFQEEINKYIVTGVF